MMKMIRPTLLLVSGVLTFGFLANGERLHAQTTTNWPAFRGLDGSGVVEGFPVRTAWNADPAAGGIDGVLWEIEIPGLGHSSPVIFGNQLFLITAIADLGTAELQIAAGGKPTAADDNGQQQWVILCYDKSNGKEQWRRTARTGQPRATRHAKATHANTSVCVDGKHVVAFLGSEGLYCYDMEGTLLWQRDLGVINISKYGIGWGYASSPAIHNDRVALVCDDPTDPFVAVLRLSDGEELWRVARNGDCERSWGTPFIHAGDDTAQVIVNGWPWIVSYDLESGEEIWRLEGGGDNPIPTPFEANGWIYITNAHGAKSPIFVVRPNARGNISVDLPADKLNVSEDAIVWSTQRGGSYMSTPVVYGDYLYLGNSNGVVRCFNAKTGEKVYEQRLGKDAGVIASLVASDDKVFCPSENGTFYVLSAGEEFKLLSSNKMSEPILATPAISEGVLYIRTTRRLVAVQ
ncbi:outer membrane protein assembly factor BamB family protein [Rubripirellula reticaptiva]|uniref:Outer membrane biogenesis protein BamB n=1 Tax=Rubripirellula reticaptiva TaxID=2528013 RepID=A0A5C6ENA0_9BACT|nr:PQQ-binding-like beta-propeller repeat protein [Rubripirellula reticaptiva]TWU49056.1 outer membrane biogenesis protein BamB [Rubripirellula reticaptiva]